MESNLEMIVDSVIYLWPVYIFLGLALRMVLRLVYGARGPASSDVVYQFVNCTSWLLLLAGMAPAILFSGASILGLVLIVLAAMTIVEAVVQHRAMHRRSTSAMLALLVERKSPLDPTMLVEGRAMPGSVARAAKDLFDDLRRGTPLATAIEHHPRALPREAVAYAAIGEVVGAEAEALKELGAVDDSQLAMLRRTCVDRVTYLVAILTMMALVTTFVMIKIVPEYEKIFEEFELELPTMTWFVIGVSQFTLNYLAVPLALLFVVGAVVAVLVGVFYLRDVPLLQPLIDRLLRAKRIADVLRILAVATEHRQSLTTVFDKLAQVYPSAFIRRKLQRIASYIAAGDDWRNVLLDARFVSQAEYALLKTADEVHNLPWALRTIASRKERRLVYRWSTAVQVAYPCVVLLIGVCVGTFAAAMFMPLVRLIQGLA